MILFKEDWNRYPTAIPDFKTTNKSFLVYCEKLRLMGVENYLFPISLLNPELQGIDPHDPDLDIDTRTKIFTECKYNIWYYLREVHRVAPMASAEGVPLLAHRGNIAYVWGCMQHLSVALTLPRQLGKSVIADAVDQWVKDVAARNTEVILITKDDDLRRKNIIRLKKSRLLLPYYISNISKQDADNTFELTNTLLGNRLSTTIGQPSLEGANKAARGLTSPVFRSDEGPFTKNIKIMLTAALPAYISASEEAAKHGNPYYIGYVTTAGQIDSPDGAFMYKIFHEGMWFNELQLFDCKNRQDMLNVIRRNSIGDDDLIYINFLHYQLGRDDEWLYRALAKTHSHGQEADRDYFNIWTNGTAEHPLDKKVLKIIMNSRRDADHVQLFERDYALKWFISGQEIRQRIARDEKMIAGIDMSEGIGKDKITVAITAEEDIKVLAVLAIKETNIYKFIDWVCDLMVEYPNLILNPENKHTGVVLIDALLIRLPALGIDPLKRIYNRIVDENRFDEPSLQDSKLPLSKRPQSFYESNKTLFGFRTSGSGIHARNKLYSDTLQTAANFGGDKVNDAGLIGEIGSLSVRDGRIDHKSGLNDDRVISWLLSVWMLTGSKNLAYYGIKKPLNQARDLTEDKNDDKPKTDYDIYKEEREKLIRNQIAFYLDKMHKTNDPIIVEQHRRSILNLEKQITAVDKLPKSINELIEDALKLRQNRINQMNGGGQGGITPRKPGLIQLRG